MTKERTERDDDVPQPAQSSQEGEAEESGEGRALVSGIPLAGGKGEWMRQEILAALQRQAESEGRAEAQADADGAAEHAGQASSGGAVEPAEIIGEPEDEGEDEDELDENLDNDAFKKAASAAGKTDDLYTLFVRQAVSYDRLSEEEEYALGRRVQDDGDEKAAKELVLHNMRLAIKMAHQYRRNWTNLMDLVQEAAAGMSIAAQKWDPDKGTRYGTYAAYWIRAQLTKFLMTNGRLIHTGNTRAGRKLYFSLPRIRRQLLAQGKTASVEAIAAEVQEDPREVARIVSRLDGRETSLSTPISEDGGATLGDTLASTGDDPEEISARLELDRLMHGLIKRYEASLSSERDLAIWKEHLVAVDPTSLVALGQRFGVSKQRMGQLAARLKKGFRRHIIDELGPHSQLSWLFAQD
jgi:RNA polymerase sigma-32 factor